MINEKKMINGQCTMGQCTMINEKKMINGSMYNDQWN